MADSPGKRIKTFFSALSTKASHWSVCALCKSGRLRQILNLSAIFFPSEGKERDKSWRRNNFYLGGCTNQRTHLVVVFLQRGRERGCCRRWREYPRAAAGADAVEGRRKWGSVVGGGLLDG